MVATPAGELPPQSATASARANPYPEVKDPICRLPLPTLSYLARGFLPWAPDAVIGTDSPMLNKWAPYSTHGEPHASTEETTLFGSCLFKAQSVIWNRRRGGLLMCMCTPFSTWLVSGGTSVRWGEQITPLQTRTAVDSSL